MRTEESTGPEVAPPADATEEKSAAARKRAAIELIARHGAALKQSARRYSLCVEDAEDAYQRGLEILLTKAPDIRPDELIRWTHTVIKHEALAVRGQRQRLLGSPPGHGGERDEDWVALIPASGEGLDERLERRERVARSREALRSLKPAELRALTLLAEGYSYEEIGEITGFSQTKINRCLAEGRERFRELVSRSEDGSRCREMRSLLSAFCDGEASAGDEQAVREHLRACAGCRATMRAYRAASGAAAALVPALPLSRSLLERTQEMVAAVQARLSATGAAGDSAVAQAAGAGGTRGAGAAALAKLLTICAGTAGGAAVCVATGVAPPPLDPLSDRAKSPTIERPSPAALGETTPPPVEYEPAPEAPPTPPPAEPKPDLEPEPEPSAPVPAEAGAIEYSPPPPTPKSEPAGSAGDSPAGEFGP